MPVKMTEQQIQKLQNRYEYLINYQSNDPLDPINPMTYVDSNGDSLLHIASDAGDVECVSLLLNAGIDPNKLGDMGNTALHYAKAKENYAVAIKLIAAGAREDIRNTFAKLASD